MKNKFTVLVLLSSFLVYYGCSATATLSGIQTFNTYSNKLKMKVGLYIPSEIKDRITTVSSGNGYSTAIQSGLNSCIENVQLSNSPISPELAKTEGFDLYVIPQIVNENASVSVQESFLTNTINSQFQTSIALKFFNSSGETIFTYTSNGAGFNNGSGSCSDIAEIMKMSMETSLRQVADNISQSVYGSAQINDFVKSK